MTAHKHVITGSPYDVARAVIAQHLCGWLSGHTAPLGHFEADAETVLMDLIEAGVRLSKAGEE